MLDEEKEKSRVNIRKTSQKLFGVRPKTYKSKHFALLTRYLHTLHENYPIYNKEVADLLEENLPSNKRVPFFRKFNRYFQNYGNTIELYKELLQNGKLYDLIRVLELKFKPYRESLSHSKNLDLIIRSAGDLKKKGQLLNPGNYVFLGT